MDLSAHGLDDEVMTFLKEQTDFTIDRVSQEGGNCDIFFGFHRIFDRRIALKIYYGTDESKSHYEARILSKLDHPNILRVRDAKRIGKSYSYFMTDEICGGDLEKCVRAGDLDLKQKLNIIHGTLHGLTELHKDKVSIVHRDLKPKNILVYSDTKQPLIADFGSVRHFDSEIGYVSSSKATLIYTPLEVFDGNKHSRQSDLYQIGVSLFQILGGYFPNTYEEWLTEKEKNRLNAIVDGYDRSVYIEKIIQKLVTKNSLLQMDTLPDFIDNKIKKLIQRATNFKLHVRYKNTAEFMSGLFKIQKSLTNWVEQNDELYATKPKGDEYRITNGKKGFSIEKLGVGGWRRSGDFSDNRRRLCDKLNQR